jgi:hypothetical protein
MHQQHADRQKERKGSKIIILYCIVLYCIVFRSLTQQQQQQQQI